MRVPQVALALCAVLVLGLTVEATKTKYILRGEEDLAEKPELASESDGELKHREVIDKEMLKDDKLDTIISFKDLDLTESKEGPTPVLPMNSVAAYQGDPWGMPQTNSYNWLKCAVNIEVSTSSAPGIGNEAWWGRNYRVMELVVGRCSTPDTTSILSLAPQWPDREYTLPRGVPLRFQKEGAYIVPYVFVPVNSLDMPSLSHKGHFSSILACHKTWTSVFLKLKQCSVVGGGNTYKMKKMMELFK